MVKVSVIIPVYNVEEYLKEALNSVINQSLKNIEIITIDDESTDNSLEILKEYAEKDKRFIILKQKNKGAGAARNTGLEHAHGEYLSFLDADDIFELKMLEKAYNKAKKLSLDLVTFGANDFKEEDLSNSKRISHDIIKRYLPKKEVFNYNDFPEYIFNTFLICAWNKLYKKDFIVRNKIKFQEIHRTEDLLFTSKALIKAKRIAVLDIPLVNYRRHVKSCQSTNDLYPKDFYHALLELKNFLINEKLFNSLKQSFTNFVISTCSYNLNSLTTQESYKELYKFLHETGLKELSINEVPENHFYNKGEYWKIKNILIINDPDEFNKLYHNKQSKAKKAFRSLFFILKKEWRDPKRAINLLRAYRKIKKQGLFNTAYYINKYPEAYSSKYNPIDYYMFYGYKKNHNPSEKFDSLYYTKKYPDIRASGENPLLHYVLHGQQEGRTINKEKDLDYKIQRKLN
jgi:glycosyltransferase involved in cell wall biosynthesis